MPVVGSEPELRLGPRDLAFNEDGLVPVVAQQWDSREVLMLAWMDERALARTLESGLATYWSRSRGEYWVKGATSGHFQRVRGVRIDCDRDAVLLLVDQTGPACHTGLRSCFDSEEIPIPGDIPPEGSDAEGPDS